MGRETVRGTTADRPGWGVWLTRTASATLICALMILAGSRQAGAHGRTQTATVVQGVQGVQGAQGSQQAEPIDVAPTTTAREVSDNAPVSIRLSREAVTKKGHEFVAEVFDSKGVPILGATLDIGGLGDDPDLRVPTRPMVASGNGYRATLDFPQDGSWVLVVRLQAPIQAVDLFTVDVRGVTPTSYTSPSRKLFQALSGTGSGSHGGESPAINGALVSHEPPGTFDLVGVLAMLAHSIGAMAWLSATLCLAFVGRIGPGAERRRITTMITKHYPLLALGGLALVLATGFANIDRSSPGLSTPKALLASDLGRLYLGLFLFKMFLVAGSVVSTWRIREMFPTRVSLVRQSNLASVGAHANEDLPDGAGPALFRLAEINAVFGTAIIAIVAVLNQIHHAIH